MLKKGFAALLLAVLSLSILTPALITPTLVKTAYAGSTDPSLARQITNAMNRIAAEYPEMRGTTIGTHAIQYGVYAYAKDNRIMFNTLYMTHRTKFEQSIRDDIAAGFHPELGWCSPAELLAFHEAAHIIDRKRDLLPRKSVVRIHGTGEHLRSVLPGYAFTVNGLNAGEAMAEVFASVYCNGGNAVERRLFAYFGEAA